MLTKILKACLLGVIAFWLVTLGWLASECYGTGTRRGFIKTKLSLLIRPSDLW